MLTNGDITVYNRKYDTVTHLNTWQRTAIRDVHIYVDHKVSVGDSGLNSADVYKIRIPDDVECCDTYLSEDAYAALDDPAGHWTLQNDDWVVLGECSLEIEKPADLKQLRMKSCKITSYSDNRFGGLPHWRIGGE